MGTVEEFSRRLAAGDVILIDGGTGTELEARGVPMNGAVWCGVAVLDHQDVVRATHEDYIRAGAELVTANTFPSNRLALEPAGFGDRVSEINRRAVETACQARENAAEGPPGGLAGFLQAVQAGRQGEQAEGRQQRVGVEQAGVTGEKRVKGQQPDRHERHAPVEKAHQQRVEDNQPQRGNQRDGDASPGQKESQMAKRLPIFRDQPGQAANPVQMNGAPSGIQQTLYSHSRGP